MKSIFELNTLKYKDNFMWGKNIGISYAYIEITERCNSSCIYCQIDKPRFIDMDNILFHKIVDELYELQVFEIRLGGGEPLLCDDIIEKVSYAKSKNIAVWVCTNGRLLNKKLAYELKRVGLTGVKISVDSCIPSIHDSLRGGNGSWMAAISAIRNAKAIGLETMINYTIGVQNINEYERMFEFGLILGCRVSTHFIMPKGRGEKYHQTYDMKNTFLKSQESIINGLNGDLYCTAGSDMIAISVTGGVRACLFSDDVANINNYTMREIIESENFRKYITKIPDAKVCEKCAYNSITGSNKVCPIISVCRGGCWFFYEKNNIN